MDPRREIEELKAKLASLEGRFNNHTNNGIDSPFIDGEANFDSLGLPLELRDAPQAAISAPVGGLTVDTQSRAAINTIISTLQALGLTL